MNHSFPVYTEQNECHDCYKCIRHCPSKAIKLKDGSASVIPELCVACGVCVKVCPAGAKKIRDDLSRAVFILARRQRVIASIAPSWHSAFPELNENQLVGALLKLGFHAVSETALGAQIVSAATLDTLRDKPPGVYISSACPAAVDYIRKYLPHHRGDITPLMSPAMAHAKLLRRHFGENAAVIFIGPCAAKKQEADRNPEILDLVLTFNKLKDWLQDSGIDPLACGGEQHRFEPAKAAEGRIYALEGGMLDTIRSGYQGGDIRYLALAGLANIDRALGDKAPCRTGKKFFIECLACEGGCINGPGMPAQRCTLADIVRIAESCDPNNRSAVPVHPDITGTISPDAITRAGIPESQVKAVLASIGKYGKSDELNCGACGYQSCRGFAKAVIAGKAERSMCLSHLRKLAQKKSNALIKYIPAGVVIADNKLNIIECNQLFSTLFDESTRLAWDARPGLQGVSLKKIVAFHDLFELCLNSGNDITRTHHVQNDRIYNISLFTVEPRQIVGAIVEDVTTTELHREQIANRAQEVIRKNITTVQRIANYLGEHMAETESLLREVASGYKHKEEPPHEQ